MPETRESNLIKPVSTNIVKPKSWDPSIDDILVSSYEDKKIPEEHRINFTGLETGMNTIDAQYKHGSIGEPKLVRFESRKLPRVPEPNKERILSNGVVKQSTKKRVTIHMQVPKYGSSSLRQPAKLIVLPDSMEDLLKVAGKLYLNHLIFDDFSMTNFKTRSRNTFLITFFKFVESIFYRCIEATISAKLCNCECVACSLCLFVIPKTC